MKEHVNLLRRAVIGTAIQAPIVGTTLNILHTATEGTKASDEVVKNIQTLQQLEQNTYLQQQHAKLLQLQQENDISSHPEYGIWHSVQIMALAKTLEFVSEELFVTEAESARTIQAYNAIYQEINDLHKGQTLEDFYNQNISNYALSTTENCLNTAFYMYCVNKYNTLEEQPNSLSRRKFLLGGAATGTLALFSAYRSLINPLSEFVARKQYPFYNNVPTNVLTKLKDTPNMEKLHQLLSPEGLSSATNITLLDQATYDQFRTDLLEQYDELLEQSSESSESILSLREHAERSTFEAYQQRQLYTSVMFSLLSDKILNSPAHDPALSIITTVGSSDTETILNMGAGLSTLHVAQQLQPLQHNIQYSNSSYDMPGTIA